MKERSICPALPLAVGGVRIWKLVSTTKRHVNNEGRWRQLPHSATVGGWPTDNCWIVFVLNLLFLSLPPPLDSFSLSSHMFCVTVSFSLFSSTLVLTTIQLLHPPIKSRLTNDERSGSQWLCRPPTLYKATPLSLLALSLKKQKKKQKNSPDNEIVCFVVSHRNSNALPMIPQMSKF